MVLQHDRRKVSAMCARCHCLVRPGVQSQEDGNFVADGQMASSVSRLGAARGGGYGYQAVDSRERTVSRGTQ